MKRELRRLAEENRALSEANVNAVEMLTTIEEQQDHLTDLNSRLARANAESAELVAELELRSQELEKLNRELARANAYASELMAEVEIKNAEIGRLNDALALANAHSAELIAETEEQRQNLIDINARLKAANEEKNRILGIAAHDLRSGMGCVMGVADLLNDTLPADDEDASELLGILRHESEYLLAMLSDLLDVSRIEDGQIELRKEPVDLGELVQEAARIHSVALKEKNQKLLLDVPDQPLYVDADHLKLRQAVDNLLSNANKYSPANTVVKVRVWGEGNEALVAVDDEGPGLTPEDLEFVFRIFQRLSAQPTGGESSHGLGLAIVKKVIGAHGGRVWAENKPAGGARFVLSLPVMEPDRKETGSA